jgi:hypothetical protein
MAHSRADVQRIRDAYFSTQDASNAAIRELRELLAGELMAGENARRAVTMVMGEEEKPLDLTTPVRPSMKDLAAKIAGNGS